MTRRLPPTFRWLLRLTVISVACLLYLCLFDGKVYAFVDSPHPLCVFQWSLPVRVIIGLVLGAFVAGVGEIAGGVIAGFIHVRAQRAGGRPSEAEGQPALTQ